MKKRLPQLCLAIVASLILISCAGKPVKTGLQQEIPTIIIPASHVKITQVSARQVGTTVIVDGNISRKRPHGRTIPKGHVDILLMDQHGKTHQQIPVKYSPEIIPRMDGMPSTFMTTLSFELPQDGVIGIKFHYGPHPI